MAVTDAIGTFSSRLVLVLLREPRGKGFHPKEADIGSRRSLEETGEGVAPVASARPA